MWKPAICSCENGKYLAIIIDNLVIMQDEIIDAKAKSYDKETKTIPLNFNEDMQSVKQKVSIFFLPFYNCRSIIDSCQYLHFAL